MAKIKYNTQFIKEKQVTIDDHYNAQKPIPVKQKPFKKETKQSNESKPSFASVF